MMLNFDLQIFKIHQWLFIGLAKRLRWSSGIKLLCLFIMHTSIDSWLLAVKSKLKLVLVMVGVVMEASRAFFNFSLIINSEYIH